MHNLSVIGVPIEVLPVLMIGKGNEDLEGLLPSGMPRVPSFGLFDWLTWKSYPKKVRPTRN